MQVEPYLFFEGQAEEAINFYRDRLGAEVVMMMRYRESPEPPPPGTMPAGNEDKITACWPRTSSAITANGSSS